MAVIFTLPMVNVSENKALFKKINKITKVRNHNIRVINYHIRKIPKETSSGFILFPVI